METEKREQTRIINPRGQETFSERKTYEGSIIPGEHPARTYQKKVGILRISQLIWYILGLVEVLLVLRLVLRAVAANPQSEFTVVIYKLSAPLAFPFSGIIGTTVLGGSVIEWSTVLGLVVYLIIAYAILKLIDFLNPVTPEEVEQKLDKNL